jgi:transcriptional regulator with XRE-family HTH domain
MDFGRWVKSLRLAQKLDIRTLAERTGVEVSTISRTENARSKVTLLTAIRLCKGLGATSDDLLEIVSHQRVVKGEQGQPAQTSVVPASDDANLFLEYVQRDEKEGKAWLSRLFARVISSGDGAGSGGGGEGADLLIPVDFLLLDSPVLRVEVRYPPTLSTKDIVALYEYGGLLTPLDIGEYIRKLRRERKVTLEHLERAALFSTSVLLHLESPAIEQIKLVDVMLLDQHLDQNGVLFSMYWDVYSFYDGLVRRYPATAERDMELVALFVLTCRWLWVMNPQGGSWVDDVRGLKHRIGNSQA